MSHTASSDHVEREVIKNVLPAVVQIVALRQQFLGNLISAWTGSGTMIHPSGIILTNCHVADPRAMGMPAPPADKLAVAITERSDNPPVVTYFADIMAKSPQLDLAILRITSRVDRKPVSKLNLPFVSLGDSDHLELGDILSIFGYPGIGGETVTFTSGSVSGFTHEQGVRDHRAWIKTDATIAGGNSGGTAVDHEGKLVGVPTQAAAGAGIVPVDARPVVDTNQDGRIDQRDTPMAIGGFINGLRPINLAKALLAEVGISLTGTAKPAPLPRPAAGASESEAGRPPSGSVRGGTRRPSTPPSSPAPAPSAPSAPPTAKGPKVTNLLFSASVARDGRPINPTDVITGKKQQIYATFEYEGLRKGTAWGQVWSLNGQKVAEINGKWEDGASGHKTLVFAASQGYLPDGQYHFALTYRNQILTEGRVMVGRPADATDIEISGQVVDQQTGRGIANALVIVLQPGVRAADFVRTQNKEMSFTSARTDGNGRFTFPIQLPKGSSYGLVAVARGYRDVAIDSALRISHSAPEKAEINPLPLMAE